MMNIDAELEELKKSKDNPFGSVEEPEEDLSLGLSNRIKEEKKKKKKKKKAVADELDDLLGGVDSFSSTASVDAEVEGIMEMAKDIKKALKKKDGKMEFDPDKFMNGEGKGRKKHKDLVKKYSAMFKTEEALMLALLKESDNDTRVIREAFMSLAKNGSVRGVMGKTATDFASALVSANSHRLAIIKQLAELKKTANDLAFKEESKRKDSDENSLDQESLGAMALRSLFGQSSREFSNVLQSSTAISEEEFNRLEENAKREVPVETYVEDFDMGPVIDKDGNTRQIDSQERSSVDFDPDMEEHLNSLSEQYKDDPIYGRSSAGDSLIRNESRGVKIKVRRWSDESTGRYEFDFVAVDKDGIEVPDYEVPDKSRIKMTWNDETGMAKDNRGRTYEVINY